MAREATVDYAKRAAELVEIRDPDGVPPHEPSTWIFDHWIDTCEDPMVTAARLREKIAAELQAAHDAGVAEGKASERALEMFVVRSVAHQVNDGDDRTAEQLIEMLLAERDDAVALARDAVRFVEEARNVRENLCMGVTMPNAWLDRAKALGKESGQ